MVKMYIGEQGGYTPIGPIQDLDISYADDCNESPSISVTIELAFEGICRASEEAIMAILGIRDAVINCCPNKRVVHLARHAKKPRTRKKNFNRAIKILEV